MLRSSMPEFCIFNYLINSKLSGHSCLITPGLKTILCKINDYGLIPVLARKVRSLFMYA